MCSLLYRKLSPIPCTFFSPFVFYTLLQVLLCFASSNQSESELEENTQLEKDNVILAVRKRRERLFSRFNFVRTSSRLRYVRFPIPFTKFPRNCSHRRWTKILAIRGTRDSIVLNVSHESKRRNHGGAIVSWRSVSSAIGNEGEDKWNVESRIRKRRSLCHASYQLLPSPSRCQVISFFPSISVTVWTSESTTKKKLWEADNRAGLFLIFRRPPISPTF